MQDAIAHGDRAEGRTTIGDRPGELPGAGALVARNFLTLGSGEAAARVIAFVATVYVARVLGAGAFGALQFAAAIVLYFNRVVDGGFDLGLGIRQIAASDPPPNVLVPSALAVRLGAALASIAVLVVLGFWVLPRPEGPVLAMFSLTLIPVALSTRWIHLGLERSRLVAGARALGEGVMVVLVVATVHSGQDLLRVPIAQAVGDTLAAVVLLVGARRLIRGRLRVSVSSLAPLARRATPLVLSAFFGLLIYNADILFLRAFETRRVVGLYAAGYTLVSFLSNLGMTYGHTLLPALTRLRDDGDGRRTLYGGAHAYAAALTLPVAAGATILAFPLIRFVFGHGYGPGAPALALLAWSVPLLVSRTVGSSALVANGREDLVLRWIAIAAGTNLLLNAILVPEWGMMGAAVATVGAEVVHLALTARSARERGWGGISWRRGWRPALATTGMVAVLLLGPSAHVVARVSMGATAYALGLILTGGVRREADGSLRLAL